LLQKENEMKVSVWIGTAAVLTAVLLVGCGQDKSNGQMDGSKYLLSQEPEGATGVSEVRADAKDKDEVVVVGRIGGMENPWVEDLAAFSIVDLALKPCNEIGDDACPKPWDYC
jgi:hypothetical protein